MSEKYETFQRHGCRYTGALVGMVSAFTNCGSWRPGRRWRLKNFLTLRVIS
jgi:hypothetical protein